MLIELIGPSATGKTTIIKKVVQGLAAQGINADYSANFISHYTRTRTIKDDVVRNLALNFILFPSALRAFCMQKEYAAFVVHCFSKNNNTLGQFISRCLSIIRQIGGQELIHRKALPDQIVLIDEGVISSLNNLFVCTDNPPNEAQIRKFANLVPLPDLIIYLDVSVPVLLDRTMKRPDLPRVIKGKSADIRNIFLRNARETFELLIGEKRIYQRILQVENSFIENCEDNVNKIITFILDRKSLLYKNKSLFYRDKDCQ